MGPMPIRTQLLKSGWVRTPKTHRIYAPDRVACSITGHITRRQLHPGASKQSRPCSTYTRSRYTDIGTVSLPASSRSVRVTAVYYELYYMRSLGAAAATKHWHLAFRYHFQNIIKSPLFHSLGTLPMP